MKQTFTWLSQRKLMVFAACLIVGMTGLLSVAQGALIPSGPAVTVTGLAPGGCGTECTGVTVTWSASVPKGGVITGFKVRVVPPSPCTGCFSPIPDVDRLPNTTSATVGITSAGKLSPGTYTATVTMTYSASPAGTTA